MEDVRKMVPLRHYLWFWWLNGNMINGTNQSVMWMLAGPKDDVQRPSKAKHEERTQRSDELDEFIKKQATGWTDDAPEFVLTGAIVSAEGDQVIMTVEPMLKRRHRCIEEMNGDQVK